jgi:hypothetical protein
MFGSKQLDDDVSLLEAGVSDESAMYVLLRLLGGAKKRKKKTYTKPKKLKHKHKKVKLAVLNFYKVQPFPSLYPSKGLPVDAEIFSRRFGRLTWYSQERGVLRLIGSLAENFRGVEQRRGTWFLLARLREGGRGVTVDGILADNSKRVDPKEGALWWTKVGEVCGRVVKTSSK